MKRKLNKVGRNTLTVSLPANWVKKNNLQGGDEIEIIEENKKLELRTDKIKKEEKEIVVEFNWPHWRYVRATIGSLYKNGYDRIVAKYDDEKTFKVIEAAVNSLIGYDLFEKEENKCVIRNLILEIEYNQKILYKLINISKTMQKIVREQYLKGVYDREQEINDYRNSGWKFRDYAVMIAKKQQLKNLENENLILWILEKVNKNYRTLYSIMKENKLRLDKEVINFYDSHVLFYDLITKNIDKFDFKLNEEINKKYNELLERGLFLIQKNNKHNGVIALLLENIRRIQDLSTPIIMKNLN